MGAGIRVVVITGDNKLTAEAICRKIGVFEDGAPLARRSMTGMAFAGLPEAEKRDILAQKVGWVVDGQLGGSLLGAAVRMLALACVCSSLPGHVHGRCKLKRS